MRPSAQAKDAILKAAVIIEGGAQLSRGIGARGHRRHPVETVLGEKLEPLLEAVSYRSAGFREIKTARQSMLSGSSIIGPGFSHASTSPFTMS